MTINNGGVVDIAVAVKSNRKDYICRPSESESQSLIGPMTEKSTNTETTASRETKTNSKRRLGKWIRIAVWGPIIIYLGIIGYLKFNESSLVFPGAQGESNWEPEFEFEDVWVDSTDGARIHGWYLPKKNASRYVLVHHGNAENVPQVAERYARKIGDAANANVLVFDYRGFGKSEGVPSETAVIDDAEAMLGWLLEKSGLEKAGDGLTYFGSSIGGGVAIGLAERQPPAYLVLDRTFDSATTPGAEMYPWVPVRYIMSNRFDSAERLKSINVPIFQSHFADDEVCSINSARILYEASPTIDKDFLELPGGGHYEPLPPGYWNELRGFFRARRNEIPTRWTGKNELKGVWNVVSSDGGGGNGRAFDRHEFRFYDKGVQIVNPRGQSIAFLKLISVDSTTSPKRLDMTDGKGIYEIKDGVLRILIGASRETYPKSFSPGNRALLYTLKRGE